MIIRITKNNKVYSEINTKEVSPELKEDFKRELFNILEEATDENLWGHRYNISIYGDRGYTQFQIP